MTDLPSWSYTGVVPMENDLSVLEAALHSGRVSAAQRGYQAEPEISTEQVMLAGPAEPDAEPSHLTAEESVRAGREFVATHIRYRLDWAAES